MDYKWEKGQEVLYHGGYNRLPGVATISRVTPAGFAVIQHTDTWADTFNLDGNQRNKRGSTWYRAWIEPATEENKAELIKEKRLIDIKVKMRNIEFTKLPVDIQEQIIAIVEAYEKGAHE